MSEDLSSKFPKASELQPIPSVRSKIWWNASLILIVTGLALLGTGGWMFYQIQVEANKPPPARILEPLAAADEIEALPPEPSLAAINPTATLPRASSQTPAVEPTGALTPEPTLTQEVDAVAISAPVEIPDLAEEMPPIEETNLPEEIALEAEVAPEEIALPRQEAALVSDDKFLEEAALAQENALTPEPAADAPLSLADNPLVVAEDETAPQEAASPAGSPPTRIVAKNINLDAAIMEVGWQQVIRDGASANVWVVADYAAGWHGNSMAPGQDGNIVLSGHHNIKGEVFRYLVDIEVGATISLYAGDQRYDYAVDDKFIVKDKGEPEAVRRANARWIAPFNEERLTLVTCWPYNTNTHRVIVIAKPM